VLTEELLQVQTEWTNKYEISDHNGREVLPLYVYINYFLLFKSMTNYPWKENS